LDQNISAQLFSLEMGATICHDLEAGLKRRRSGGDVHVCKERMKGVYLRSKAIVSIVWLTEETLAGRV